MKYFHKLTDEEFHTARKNKTSIEEFSQPDWCAYPSALAGLDGCWSLLDRSVRSIVDCKGCELNKEENHDI